MKITTGLLTFATIASLSLPAWALRGVKEGGGDDAVIFHCYALSKSKLEIVGLSYDDSEQMELRVFENRNLKSSDYGIWNSLSATYSGYRFELNLNEKSLATKNGFTLLGKNSFLNLKCARSLL